MKTTNSNLLHPASLIALLIAIIFSFSNCKKNDDSDNIKPGSGNSGNPPANEVWIQSMAFNPTPISVTVNTTVKWTNKDGEAHTVTSDTGGIFDSGNLTHGGIFSYQFTTAGSFPYHCNLHAGMTGTVTVH